jgi:1,4-dihydroxy-2-naphthoate octaprenyltransferase
MSLFVHPTLIVYANDYADYQVDTLMTPKTIFSGGSRVLVDGDITPEALRKAAFLMAAKSLGTALLLIMFYRRPGHCVCGDCAAAPVCLQLPAIQTFLSRWWGISQMIGVGVFYLIWLLRPDRGFHPFSVLALLDSVPTNLACL